MVFGFRGGIGELECRVVKIILELE
jgi:hypothetical protein